MKTRPGKPKGETGAILEMFLGICFAYHHWYCWASQDRMLRLLNKWETLSLARSTLNLWLNYLESDGWMVRYRYWAKNIDGLLVNRPSRFYLTEKAIKYLKTIKKCVQKVWRFIDVRLHRQDIGKTVTRSLKSTVEMWKSNSNLAFKQRLKPSEAA